ncbi:hypothetical protein RF11_12150 [Thelohanellus kitauei]|uniref:General transcription factor II-I repeat domain-containing protein 2 n=1 Tax=Thelohanellus kitauei TaxID=669202 RepID=A0A0C2M7G5_THEKT|nr:hypothetical protein RF11_12150 [Thelohanellus kitauei]
MASAKEYNVGRHYEYIYIEFEQYIGNLQEEKLLRAELTCPHKRQAFSTISLSGNMIAEKDSDVARDLESQLSKKMPFFALSIAIDETDDLYKSLLESLDGLDVDSKHAVSLVTDRAPQMICRKLQTLNVKPGFCNFHCSVHHESLFSQLMRVGNIMNVMVKWINFIRAKGFNHRQFNSLLEEKFDDIVRFLLCRFLSRLEIKTCMEMKECPVAELSNDTCLTYLSFG